MKTGKKLIIILTAVLITAIIVSCVTQNVYLPLTEDEVVIGTVQAAFVTQGTAFVTKGSINRVNTQAYIALLDAAGNKYPGTIDVRDILWVPGRMLFGGNTEISATGKVIQTKGEE